MAGVRTGSEHRQYSVHWAGGIELFPTADFSDGQMELAMVRGLKLIPVLPLIPQDHSWC